VRATLAYGYLYLNTWDLYCGSEESRKKIQS
jgi:hypothetical protein